MKTPTEIRRLLEIGLEPANPRARNRRKRKGVSVRNLALLVAAATLIGSALLIWQGETNPRPGYAVKEPGGISIYP